MEDVNKEVEKFFGVLLLVCAPFLVDASAEFLEDLLACLSTKVSEDGCGQAGEVYSKVLRTNGVNVR